MFDKIIIKTFTNGIITVNSPPMEKILLIVITFFLLFLPHPKKKKEPKTKLVFAIGHLLYFKVEYIYELCEICKNDNT